MSATRKTAPYWVKLANAPAWARKVWHRAGCDGTCGIENMSAAELSNLKNKPSCWITLANDYVDSQKIYNDGTRGKWGVKLYNRRERASVRTKLAKMVSDPESDEPEPYRGRNRNKWDME